MTNERRLDFKVPPPLYRAMRTIDGFGFIDGDGATHTAAMDAHGLGWHQDVAHARAWAHHKARHNPPGMWSGFYGRLPDLKVYTPRMGFVHGMECTVAETEHDTHEGAQRAGRAAAWARYERAIALVNRIERSDAVLLMFQIVTGGDPWPRCIHWPDHYVEVVEHWIAKATDVLR